MGAGMTGMGIHGLESNRYRRRERNLAVGKFGRRGSPPCGSFIRGGSLLSENGHRSLGVGRPLGACGEEEAYSPA